MLHVKADLENVKSLALVKGGSYCIDVRESAGSEQRDGVYVTAAETHDLAGSKGSANVRAGCSFGGSGRCWRPQWLAGFSAVAVSVERI